MFVYIFTWVQIDGFRFTQVCRVLTRRLVCYQPNFWSFWKKSIWSALLVLSLVIWINCWPQLLTQSTAQAKWISLNSVEWNTSELDCEKMIVSSLILVICLFLRLQHQQQSVASRTPTMTCSGSSNNCLISLVSAKFLFYWYSIEISCIRTFLFVFKNLKVNPNYIPFYFILK